MRKQLPPKSPDKPRSDWLRSLRGIRGMERSCPECGRKAGELHKDDCSRRRMIKREKPK
jgi:hypothetical protein